MRLLNTWNYHTRYIATGYAVNRRKAPARRVSSIKKNVLEDYLYTRSHQPLNFAGRGGPAKTGLLLDFLLSHASLGRLVPFSTTTLIDPAKRFTPGLYFFNILETENSPL